MLAGPSPPRPDDDDRLRLPPAPPPRNSKAEKKQSVAHRPSQLCPPYVTPFSRCSPDRHHNGVHTAENGYATRGSLNRKCQSSVRPCTDKSGRWDQTPLMSACPLTRLARCRTGAQIQSGLVACGT